MKGKTIAVGRKGRIAVQTSGGITVLELMGGYNVEINDIFDGELDSLGSEVVLNVTQDEEMDVFIQGVDCSASLVQKFLHH